MPHTTCANYDVHPGFLKTRKEIEVWLLIHKIYNYTINENLEIDCPVVDLKNKGLKFIPVQFGNVNKFVVSDNMLTSLRGSPKYSVYFDCSSNFLASLEFAPLNVKTSFSCYKNQLTSLEHSPIMEDGEFNCCYNKLKNLIGYKLNDDYNAGSIICNYNQITSLEGAPSSLVGDFQCQHNLLKDLQYAPKSVGSNFFFDNNLLQTLKGAPKNIKGHFSIRNNPTLLSIDCIPIEIGRCLSFDNCGPLFEKYQGIDTDGTAVHLLEKIRLEQKLSNKGATFNNVIKI